MARGQFHGESNCALLGPSRRGGSLGIYQGWGDPRLLVAERWQSTINSADLEGFMALDSGEAHWGQADKDAIRDFFGWRAALNAQYRLTDCEVGVDTVTCAWSATDDFLKLLESTCWKGE